MVIPERFASAINTHLLGNMIHVKDYPLILYIVGRPGMGKTWQLRHHLEALGFAVYSISSADLEDKNAGEPAKLIRTQYVNASMNLSSGNPSALVIDDIDTTVGEWEQNTGTVNHEGILAFLMHIADNPTHIEIIGNVNRVPIFFTGNCFERLYEPLRRPGRMIKFEWEPTREEKAEIVASIFSFTDKDISRKLVMSYPNEQISFFSSLLVTETISQLAEIASNAAFKHILSTPSYKAQLQTKFLETRDCADWSKLAKKPK